MKKLLITIGLALSLNVSANELHLDTALFGGSNTGIYVDIGTENFRFELPVFNDSNGGFAIKAALKVSDNYKVWFGSGELSPKESVIDTSDTWERSVVNFNKSFPSLFIELEHSSGIFVRATHYDGSMSATFEKYSSYYMVDDQRVRDLIVTKVVTKEADENLLWVGYKFKF